jgi:LAS superfamily LD-carboxypeptidase LdcB
LPLIAAAAAGFLLPPAAAALNLERLEPAQAQIRQGLLQALEPLIAAKRKDGTAILLTWEQLYAPLDLDQRAFLDAIRALKGSALGATSHFFGEPPTAPDVVPVGPQQILKDGVPTPLDPQYLPRPALEAYRRMMAAMRADLGRELLVESGYRSPAYQLYLFVYYMGNHDLSIRETNRFVALPGHSEHGYPPRQALDFINQDGINGEERPEEFEALPEYAWLQLHAQTYGFFLSYPRDNPHHTAFEPWHWRFESP